MGTSLTERLVAHLDLCPCCHCEARAISKPEDGIPEEYIHETAFLCGARIFVTRSDDYAVAQGCPYPADDSLQDFRQDLLDGNVLEEGDDQP